LLVQIRARSPEMSAIACVTGPALLLAQWRSLDACSGKVFECGPSTYEVGRRYELGRRLGAGAFGEVFRATSRRDGREYALKIVGKRGAGEREAIVQSGLEHPHIARMIESFWAAGRLCIATEICEGGLLFDALEHHGRFPESQARAAFSQMLGAVAYLHSRAVAHRDLKLESFLLKRNGASLGRSGLKLIDFGFARRFTPGERSLKTKCGSRGFFAPEVLRDDAYDERCDVYSCGVILHCLLCDDMPFAPRPEGDSPGRAGDVGFGGEEVRRSITVAARKTIAWVLERSPENRPHAQQVLESSWLQVRKT